MYTIFSNNFSLTFEAVKWTDINCPAHCHHNFEAIFVTSGTIIIEKNDTPFILAKNDAIIVMPFEKHKFITQQHSEILVLEISPRLISNFDSLFKHNIPKNPVTNFTSNEISEIHKHIQLAQNNLIEINCLFFLIMSKLLRNNELVPFAGINGLLQEAMLYIGDHFTENLCLKDVAQALNVSYVYLSRLFSKNSTIKFNDLLNSFRIHKATSLLCNPEIPIIEISFSCGFGSLRNFNRVFLNVMQCTPSEFRKKSLISKNKNPFHYYE